MGGVQSVEGFGLKAGEKGLETWCQTLAQVSQIEPKFEGRFWGRTRRFLSHFHPRTEVPVTNWHTFGAFGTARFQNEQLSHGDC